MATKKVVYVIVGDIGGAKEAVPAGRELDRRGYDVRYFLDPSPKAKAGSVLNAAGLKYEVRGPAAEDKPDVIVIGTSATANETQISFTEFGLAMGISVIWIEDLWGTGERKSLHSISPNAQCVIDKIAETVAKNVRPDVLTYVTGKPSFETLPALIARKAEVRKAVRATLNVGENDFFVPWLFGGDPAERSWAQLHKFAEEGVDFAKTSGIVFGLRFHPKHPEFDKQMEFVASLGIKSVDTRPIKGEEAAKELMLAADSVFADWGNTDAVVSLLAHVPVATLIFPDDSERLNDCGYINGVPPLLMNFEDWGMKNVNSMLGILDYARSHGYGANAAQEITVKRAENFQQLLEPGATGRIANVVESYLQ